MSKIFSPFFIVVRLLEWIKGEIMNDKRKVLPSTAIRVASTLAYVGAVMNGLIGLLSIIKGNGPPFQVIAVFFKAYIMFLIGQGLIKYELLFAWLSVIISVAFVIGIFILGLNVITFDVIIFWAATIIVSIKWREFA